MLRIYPVCLSMLREVRPDGHHRLKAVGSSEGA